MSELSDFSKVRLQQDNFAENYPLENEVLGNHPYIRIKIEENKPKAVKSITVLFVKKKFESQALEELSQKIIQSFAVEDSESQVINLEENTTPADIDKIKNIPCKMVVFFTDLLGFETVKKGSFLKNAEFGGKSLSIYHLWPANELQENPELKKKAWGLIKQAKDELILFPV